MPVIDESNQPMPRRPIDETSPPVPSKKNEDNKKTNNSKLSEKELIAIYMETGLYETEAQAKKAIAGYEKLNQASKDNQNKKVEKDEAVKYEGYFGNPRASKPGILGFPHMFNELADPLEDVSSDSKGKVTKSKTGRVFRRNIIQNAPLVIFQIGTPLFMEGASKEAKGAIEKLMSITDDNERDSVFSSLAGSGYVNNTRYYGFKDAHTEYADYVNTMCRYTALRMGIGDMKNEELNQKYGEFDIIKLKDDSLFSRMFTGESRYVAMYAERSSSHSEGGNNSTGDSMLAGATKKAGQLTREVEFLFGSWDQNKLEEQSVSNYNETVSKLTDGIGNPTSFLTRAKNSVDTILSGGNLLFPEIWQDSQYRKSYTVDMKFHTPYGDAESVFLNVYVPFFHVLGMVMPRQNSKQGFQGPFILKAYSKGWFNCDLGMIESVDVKKGGNSGNEWTVDGLPTEIDVSITLKDLYPTLMMTGVRGVTGVMFYNNTGLVEYLNMMSGVEMHRLHPVDNLNVLLGVIKGQVMQIDDKLGYLVSDKIYQTIMNVANKVFPPMFRGS